MCSFFAGSTTVSSGALPAGRSSTGRPGRVEASCESSVPPARYSSAFSQNVGKLSRRGQFVFARPRAVGLPGRQSRSRARRPGRRRAGRSAAIGPAVESISTVAPGGGSSTRLSAISTLPSSTLASSGCDRSQSMICGPTALASASFCGASFAGSVAAFALPSAAVFVAAAPGRPRRQPADEQRVRPRHRRPAHIGRK